MFTNKPDHLRSFDYLGPYRYSLTFCTHERHRAFVDAPVVTLAREQILRAATQQAFAVIAYCFMPDHLHLLVEGTSAGSDCRRFISRAKQYSGFYHSKVFGTVLWQRYGFERVLRNDEATLVVARYILENPIRARLVESIEDYPFAGSAVYSLKELLESVCQHLSL